VESNVRLKQAFGKILLQLREQKEVSQKEVADNCNLERAYISRLERGLLQPSLTTIVKIAEYFNVSPGVLIDQAYALLKKKR